MLMPYIGIVTIALTQDISTFGAVSILAGLRKPLKQNGKKDADRTVPEGWCALDATNDPSSKLRDAGWVWEAPASFGAQMRLLDRGVMAELPTGIEGKFIPFRIRGWVLLLSADFPAAGSLLPFTMTRSIKRC